MKNKLLLLTLLYFSLMIRSHANEQWIVKLNKLFPTEAAEVIEITGRSSRSVIAEAMEIQIPVKSQAAELVSAYEENKKITAKLVEQLRKIGIADNAIRSSIFSYSDHLDAMTKREKDEDRKYEIVTHTNVLLKNADQFILLAEVLNKDIEPYDEIRYYHSKDDEYREVVLVEAMNDVKKQQDSYEEMFGVRLELSNIERKVTLPRLDSSMGSPSEYMKYEATIVAKFIIISGATNDPIITVQQEEPIVTTPVDGVETQPTQAHP